MLKIKTTTTIKTFLGAFAFTVLLTACASTKNTAGQEMIQIKNAAFKPWRSHVNANTEIPERGTDLKVTLTGWADDYEPVYIIFRSKKSFVPEIVDSTDSQTIIRARIIRQSSVLQNRSESVDATDRLVYIDDPGKTRFIEIDDWERAEE